MNKIPKDDFVYLNQMGFIENPGWYTSTHISVRKPYHRDKHWAIYCGNWHVGLIEFGQLKSRLIKLIKDKRYNWLRTSLTHINVMMNIKSLMKYKPQLEIVEELILHSRSLNSFLNEDKVL